MSVKFLFPSVLVLAVLSICQARGQGLLDLPDAPEAVSPAPAPAAEGTTPLPTGILPPYHAQPVVEAPAPARQGPGWVGSQPDTADQPEQLDTAPTPVVTPGAGPLEAAAGPPANQPPGSASPGPNGGPALSPWEQYLRPFSCYCPIGGHGPVQMELYLRNGISVPYGNSIAGKELDPGWVIQGGLRTMLFEPTMTSAWVVDLGLMNTFNRDTHPVPFAASALEPTATSAARVFFGSPGGPPGLLLHNINRTWASFGLGKMWYINGAANSPGPRWRWGVDGGGRYGTERFEFYSMMRHRSDVIGSGYAAVYSDLELPCGCCTWIAGFRVEYAYTEADILHSVNADIQDINLLFNFGVRY